MGQTTPKKITIYVRRGSSDDDRLVTFKRVPEISAKEALDAGLAIDGNSFALSVGLTPATDWDNDRIPEYTSTLSEAHIQYSVIEALAESEKLLLQFLDKYGYELDFA